MNDEEATLPGPRPKISADTVFFTLASRLSITPTMTFAEEVADFANRNATNEIWVHKAGQLMVVAGQHQLSPEFLKVAIPLVDMHGLVDGEWPEILVKACEAGCSVYGILGMS